MKYARRFWRLLGFVAVPILSAASPLIALPALTAAGGSKAWSAVAIGQSIGMAGATVIELGWGLSGPQAVAKKALNSRRAALALSLQTRIAVLGPIAVVTATLAFTMATENRTLGALTAIGTSLGGLSLGWYFIGIGSPGLLLIADAVPRVALVITAAVAINAGHSILLYPTVGIALPSIIAVAAGTLVGGVRRRHFMRLGWKRLKRCVAIQAIPMRARLTSTLYIALPVTLVGISAPSAVASFAAVERLQRMYLSVLSVAPNLLQHWVGSEPNKERRVENAKRAVAANAALGIVAGSAFALSAPALSEFIFSGTSNVPTELSLWSAVLIFLVCTSRALGGILLVALREVGAISRSASLGAAIGVPAILLLSRIFGAVGGLIGEVLAEFAVLAIQIRGWRARRW